MFDELGVPYAIFVLLIYLTVALDAFNYVQVFIKKKIDKYEFCTVGIKWFKIAMGIAFAAILSYLLFTQESTPVMLMVQLVDLVLLIVDSVFSIILKIRYGKGK